jgi:hypothetical protein
MRTERGRTKKLILAFWFHSSGEPGWKCEECRSQGLEERRRCGYLGLTGKASTVPVWSRGGVVELACPKPKITAGSMAMLAAYRLWVSSGRRIEEPEMRAKCVDAFAVLGPLVERLRTESCGTSQ